MRFRAFSFRICYLLLGMFLTAGELVWAQDSSSSSSSTYSSGSSSGSSTGQSSSSGTTGSTSSDTSQQTVWPGHIPLPSASTGAGSSSSYQVDSPSVVLPTPDLPPLTSTNSQPEASPTPAPEASATPMPTPAPVFNPPSAERLNLPSAQPAGNYAPASVGMPTMKLDDDSAGPGALAGMFDWAKKLRFDAAFRTGYDDNVNSASGTTMVTVTNPVLVTNSVEENVVSIKTTKIGTNVVNSYQTNRVSTNVVSQTNQVTQQQAGVAPIASTYVNLNGGVNYRFGAPRLNLNVNLTGGITRYLNSSIAQPLQGTAGLGIAVEYRFSPRMVFTFNSSSSFQQQPNLTLIGTANNSGNNSYYYTANSLAGAYQWSDLFTTVTRLDLTGSYYPGQTSQGFSTPAFTESFRYLVKPTTTAVTDYNVNYYGYGNNGNSSLGQSLLFGFDHVFNPKWFWNFRLGAEFRNSQNVNTGSSTYFGPSADSNFSWALAKRSSVSWVAHLGTQPSGQNNASYAVSLSSGLNYTQGIFTKLTFSAGVFYLLSQYPNVAVAQVVNGVVQYNTQSYSQNNLQANAAFEYRLNRIIDLSLGYQYIATSSSSSLGQTYNRGISYLQISAGL